MIKSLSFFIRFGKNIFVRMKIKLGKAENGFWANKSTLVEATFEFIKVQQFVNGNKFECQRKIKS